MAEAALARHRETVRDDWIDYNGHMNVAYYVLIFDHGTDVLLDELGIGEAYAASSQASTFALEAHITYQRELLRGATARVETQLIDFDHKRLHYFHSMYDDAEDYLAATLEQISMHVDLQARKSAPFPDDVLRKMEAMMRGHGQLPRPKQLGSQIAIPG